MNQSELKHLTPDPSGNTALSDFDFRQVASRKARQQQGKLAGRAAVITGGDSGVGRSVAIAFAREGADILVSYEHAHEDARETQRLVEETGRKCVLVSGDMARPEHCRAIIRRALEELGGIDILVNNAAFRTFQTNITAMFHLCKAAVPHMPRGSVILNTSLVSLDTRTPRLLAYSAAIGAATNFAGGLALLLAEKGIRVNLVAQNAMGTSRVSGMLPPEQMKECGQHAGATIRKPGQPRDMESVFVYLASDEAGHMSGVRYEVPGPTTVH